MTTIEIHADTYHAEIALDMLTDLPTSKIRKLLQLIYRYSYENSEAIQTITEYLPKSVCDAKAEWYIESQEYANGWKKVNSRSRRAWVVEQRKKNRMLTEAVKCAKANYEKHVKLQSIFNEIKEKYYA